MDLTSQKSKLNKQITIFKWIGGISALIALIPLIWAGIQVYFIEVDLTIVYISGC
jgi:hypothetical protein